MTLIEYEAWKGWELEINHKMLVWNTTAECIPKIFFLITRPYRFLPIHPENIKYLQRSMPLIHLYHLQIDVAVRSVECIGQ